MDTLERRQHILERLQNSMAPLSASRLAAEFDVSRQIVVGDIALLRAAGHNITATPRGYLLLKENTGIEHVVACIHKAEEMRAELYIMVDNGCVVKDVIIDHPIYGQLTGQLQLSSRYDVDEFIRKSGEAEAKPLSLLTDGIHLHTMVCPEEAAYIRVKEALKKAGFLLEDTE